jgi:methyltransferase
MVLLHTAFLIACPLEVFLFNRNFVSWLGIPALLLCIATQALRWWVIQTLGWRWNTRVIVVPGLAPVGEGPFRYLNHPNYLAVVVELLMLPLVHSAWMTALLFSILNLLLLLKFRIPVEDRALQRGP